MKFDGFKIDAHVHSHYSEGSYLKKSTVPNILNRAMDAGLDGLVVTDTNVDEFFARARNNIREYAPDVRLVDANNEVALFERIDKKKLYLLRGMEFHDDTGHLLVIGGERRINYSRNRTPPDRIKEVHDNNGLIGAAHPYDVRFGGMGEKALEKISGSLDFIEVFNALSFRELNDRALAASYRFNLPGLSNSDDHNVKPGTCYTILELDPNGDSVAGTALKIKSAIRNGYTKILGAHQQYISMWEKAWIFGAKEIAHGKFAPVIERVVAFTRKNR